jgi:hypothetical protein
MLDFVVVMVIGLALALACGLVVWPDVACQNFLNNFITDRLQTSGYTFRLFTNNITPGTATVLANFTEASFTGYAAVSGSTITWSAAALSGHIAFSNGSNITFNNTSAAPVTIYGVYVTNAANTVLYYAELDPNAPISIPASGQYIYTPNQQFKSIN